MKSSPKEVTFVKIGLEKQTLSSNQKTMIGDIFAEKEEGVLLGWAEEMRAFLEKEILQKTKINVKGIYFFTFSDRKRVGPVMETLSSF